MSEFFQASADKTHRTLSNNLADLAKKCDTAALHLSDFDREKRRLASENADLLREVQELSANASLMLKTKASLVSALDEAKVAVVEVEVVDYCLKYPVHDCLNSTALIIVLRQTLTRRARTEWLSSANLETLSILQVHIRSSQIVEFNRILQVVLGRTWTRRFPRRRILPGSWKRL